MSNVTVHSAETINAEYRKSKASAVDSANRILRVGQMLTDKKAELGHGNFIPWVEANCDFQPRAAQRMMKSYSKASSRTHLAETDALEIASKTWGNSVTHGTQGTGENEWYTPARYVEMARQVLGSIDTDPASSPSANEVVQAAQYFSREDDGLSKPWTGNVWMNPPYSRDLLPLFVDKFLSEWDSKNIRAGIVLTHAYTDTSWFHKLAVLASPICLTAGRIKFLDTDGVPAAPTQGQAFFYFGDNPQEFSATFAETGIVFPGTSRFTRRITAQSASPNSPPQDRSERGKPKFAVRYEA
jgi:hypothetical protein